MRILQVISLLISFQLSAQINSHMPYPDMGGEGDPSTEEVTDVFLKIRQSQKLITFEYVSHGASWEVEIRDLQGSIKMKSKTIKTPDLLVNSTDLSAGTYLCTLYTSNSIITKKLVLE